MRKAPKNVENVQRGWGSIRAERWRESHTIAKGSGTFDVSAAHTIHCVNGGGVVKLYDVGNFSHDFSLWIYRLFAHIKCTQLQLSIVKIAIIIINLNASKKRRWLATAKMLRSIYAPILFDLLASFIKSHIDYTPPIHIEQCACVGKRTCTYT